MRLLRFLSKTNNFVRNKRFIVFEQNEFYGINVKL